jgi:archaellum component FlaC
MNMKKISVILGLIIALTVIVGAGAKLDRRWAKADQLVMVAQRLDQKIIQDRINAIQERLWRLEDKYGNIIADMASTIRDQYRRLLKEIKDLEKRLKKN